MRLTRDVKQATHESMGALIRFAQIYRVYPSGYAENCPWPIYNQIEIKSANATQISVRN